MQEHDGLVLFCFHEMTKQEAKLGLIFPSEKEKGSGSLFPRMTYLSKSQGWRLAQWPEDPMQAGSPRPDSREDVASTES